MKFKRILTAGLATIMAVSAMSLSALAADDDAVISYIDENGAEVNITQADLDEGHWDKDALGGIAPFVYENFPMTVNSYVDDYSNIQLQLGYLKSLSDGDSASLEIVDIFDDTVVNTYDNIQGTFYSDILSVGKDYMLTLTETIDGVTTEYVREVSVTNETAEMPEYVTDENTTAENIILVGNVEDLKASESVDENGEITIDSSMKRFEKVTAAEFAEYKNSLDNDSVYKIYTVDENNERYSGFISTSADGEQLGVYKPDITVRSWESYMSPAPMTLPSNYITASRIQSATKVNMTYLRDFGFSLRDSVSYFKVFAFQIPESDVERENFCFSYHADQKILYEVWAATSLTATPRKIDGAGKASTDNEQIFTPGPYASVDVDDYIFFVIYAPNATDTHGMIGVDSSSFYPTADVTGSSYEAYNGKSVFDYNQMKVGSTKVTLTKTATLYDDKDADAYYLNYTDTSSTKFAATLSNNINDYSAISIELATYNGNLSYLMTNAAPDDVYTVPIGGSKTINFSASKSNQIFLTVFGNQEPRKSVNYSLSCKIR